MLLVGAAFMLIEEYRTGGGRVVSAIAFLAVGVYWFVFRRFHLRWVLDRRFHKRPDRDIEIEWRVNEEQVRIHSAIARSESSWSAFTKMVRTPRGILLYPINEMYYWLPRRGFENDAEYERYLRLAKDRIAKYYDVT